MNTSVAEIAKLVGGRVVGDGDTPITGLSGIRQAGPGDLTFVADARYSQHIERTAAAAILVRPDVEPHCSKPLIQVADPYRAFGLALQRFRPNDVHRPVGIHPTAVLGKDVRLGGNVALGALCYVGDGSILGDGVVLHPGVYVGPACRIGDGTVIHANATVREACVIGARCIIHCGAAIGSDGFGFMFADGRHQKIPQTGTVEIGDDVEIGANSAVDRATFGKTTIGSGTKIDNLVQIGHNTDVGEHCIICGNVGISGSAVIGNRVTVAAAAGIAGHIEIGDNVTVGGMSGVTKSVPPGSRVSGFPAIDHEAEKRIKASLKRLPEALRTIRGLEQRIKELENRLDARTTEDNR